MGQLWCAHGNIAPPPNARLLGGLGCGRRARAAGRARADAARHGASGTCSWSVARDGAEDAEAHNFSNPALLETRIGPWRQAFDDKETNDRSYASDPDSWGLLEISPDEAGAFSRAWSATAACAHSSCRRLAKHRPTRAASRLAVFCSTVARASGATTISAGRTISSRNCSVPCRRRRRRSRSSQTANMTRWNVPCGIVRGPVWNWPARGAPKWRPGSYGWRRRVPSIFCACGR